MNKSSIHKLRARASNVSRAVLSILFPLGLLIILCSCNSTPAIFHLSSTFYSILGYDANAGKHLGLREDDMYEAIYELKGLPQDEFLYMKRNSWSFFSTSSERFLMNSATDEPIYKYGDLVSQIDVTPNYRKSHESDITIRDSDTIEALVLLRTKGLSEVRNIWDDVEYINDIHTNDFYYDMVFMFDLPCDLKWKNCIFKIDGEDTIYWRCFDNKSDQYIYYDATNILTPYFE